MMAKYWFRRKSYGYGATPNTWQGWTLTITGGLLVFIVIVLAPLIRDNLLRAAWIALGLAAVLAPTILVSHRKTEGGWRWRFGRDG